MKHEMTRRLFLGGALGVAMTAFLPGRAMADLINFNFLKKKGAVFPYTLTEPQWHKKLGDDGYAILRNGDNETAGTALLLREHRKGTYLCRGCAQPLFASSAKMMVNDFPTFREPLNVKSLGTSADFGILLPRTELHCINCGSHLGYKVMPQREGGAEAWRYVINGASLTFKPA